MRCRLNVGCIHLALQCMHSLYCRYTLYYAVVCLQCTLKRQWYCMYTSLRIIIRSIYTEIGQDNLHKSLVNSYTKDLKSNPQITYFKTKTVNFPVVHVVSKQTGSPIVQGKQLLRTCCSLLYCQGSPVESRPGPVRATMGQMDHGPFDMTMGCHGPSPGGPRAGFDWASPW